MVDISRSGIYVVSAYGVGAIGTVVPVTNMPTNMGRITMMSGELIQTDNSGTFYDHQLSILSGTAASTYSWPTEGSGEKFGHAGLYPDGNIYKSAAGSGMAYSNGSTRPKIFSGRY